MVKNHPLDKQGSGVSKQKSFPIHINRNVIFPALMVLGSILILFLGQIRMKNAYQTAEQNAYNGIYQTAFDIAEAQNHVSNYAVISVEGIQKVSRLEVLTVSGSEFVIKNADSDNKTVSWLEIQGTGVFTVDLSASEFIVDPERQSVLVKIPKPVLTECTVTGTGKHFWNNGGIFYNFFKGSVADGVRLSQEQMSEGRMKLETSMRQSRIFNDASKDAAVNMIQSLVQQWNPNVPDLQIEVKFIENN